MEMEEEENCEEEYTKPIISKGKFYNPWSDFQDETVGNALKFLFISKNKTNLPAKEELDRILPVIRDDIPKLFDPPSSDLQVMWIGHSTVLVQFDGITVLTDPIFSKRCSMTQWIGPKRFRKPPCTVDELPQINAVVISHNHYDHLDYNSVRDLNRRFGKDLFWFVPQKLKNWMVHTGGCPSENVTELSWWEESVLPWKQDVRFCCTPASHVTIRNMMDRLKTLWCSWSVVGPKHSFFFGGDSGYCEAFKQIGRKFGKFTLAALPIGSYDPSYYMKPMHMNPEEAVQIHEDIHAEYTLGIHWGTFTLAYEFYLEPRDWLLRERDNRGLKDDSVFTLCHGEVKILHTKDDEEKTDV